MLALIAAGCSSLLVPTVGRTPVRHGALRMQAGMLPTGGSDLEANNDQGNTFWATHSTGVTRTASRQTAWCLPETT